MDGKRKLKMALASIDGSPGQHLGAVWTSKMAAKGASKENLHLETYFHCELALRRLGKDILTDKCSGFKKEAQNVHGLH